MNFDYAREIELTVLTYCSHTRYTAVRIRSRSRILQRGVRIKGGFARKVNPDILSLKQGVWGATAPQKLWSI